jgi:hypothetical protein
MTSVEGGSEGTTATDQSQTRITAAGAACINPLDWHDPVTEVLTINQVSPRQTRRGSDKWKTQ